MIEKSSSALEKTVLVGIITINQSKQVLEEYLNELSFLTFTAGGEVVKKITQKMDSPDPKLFLGKGKMEELASYIKRMEINSVIFDDELTPAQQLNIEKFLKCKIVDRTGLILDISLNELKQVMQEIKLNLLSINIYYLGLKGFGHI